MTKTYKLSKTQHALLANKFGTYQTHNWGDRLNASAYHWIAQALPKTAVIDSGDAMMPTTVRFTKRPYFTCAMIKELKQ